MSIFACGAIWPATRQEPWSALTTPFDGLCYRFNLIDPENRLRLPTFLFLVRYSQDEESLIVVRGGYERTEGM